MTQTDGCPSLKRSWKRDALILILVQIGIGLPYLSTVPRVYNDDVWEASLGHSLANEGVLRHGIIEGWGGMHVRFVQNQVVQPFVLAAAYRQFGFSLFVSRFASVLAGAAALLAVYAVMRTLFDRRSALIVGLLTAIHPWFFEITRRVRPDVYVVALVFAGLWLWIRAIQNGGRVQPLGAGLLAAAAGLAHPNGFVLSAALFVGVLAWRRPARIGRIFGWGAVGAIAGVMPYVAYVLWATRDPSVDFFEQMRGAKSLSVADPMLLLQGEIGRWKHFFQWPKGAPLALLFGAGWLLAWFRSTSADKALAASILLFALALPFTTVNTTSRYLVGLLPLLCGLLVRLLQRVTPNAPAQTAGLRWRWGLAAVVAGAYVACCVLATGLLFHRLRNADFDRVVERVVQVTGPDAHVVGEQLFWMGHARYRFGPVPIPHPWSDRNTEPAVEVIRRYQPEYAVRSAWNFNSSYGVSSPPASMPAWRAGQTIDEVCRRFGHEIAAFRDPYFGPIEVYRLTWAAPTGGSATGPAPVRGDAHDSLSDRECVDVAAE